MSLIRATTFCRTSLGPAGQDEVSNYSHENCTLVQAVTSDLFVSQDIKSIYNRQLLIDIEYKKLKMREVLLEIKKLEKEVST